MDRKLGESKLSFAKSNTLLEGQDAALLQLLIKRSYMGSTLEKTLQSYMKLWGCSFFTALSETHVISESRLADLVAELLNIPRLKRLTYLEGSARIQEILPFTYAQKFVCIPVVNQDEVALAHPYPVDQEFIETFSKDYPQLLRHLCIVESSEIRRAIVSTYPLTSQMPNLFR